MTVYRLEMRSTADWQDVRYRTFTTSARKAEAFKKIPPLRFAIGNGHHHFVTCVGEHSGKRGPIVMHLREHVSQHMPRLDPTAGDRRRWRALADSGAEDILQRLIANYDSQSCPISDSDLDREQPISFTFRGTLGDIRTARTVVSCLQSLHQPAGGKQQ